MQTPFFHIEIPTQAQDHKILANILPGADSLAVSEIAAQFNGLTVVVTNDTRSAVRLEKELAQLSPLNVTFFPDWETLPYDSFSPHQDIISARLSALFHLQQRKHYCYYQRFKQRC